MGYAALPIIILLEVFLAFRTCIKKQTKSSWAKERLAVRAIEALVIILLLCFSRQKWRFVPALFILALLLFISILSLLLSKRKRRILTEQGQPAEKPKKAFAAIFSCIFSVLLLGLFLIPALLFTDYSGLPVSGEHKVAETAAILVDRSRPDPFEGEDRRREVPVHFYYPAEEGKETYPLILFSHGAFGYYQSNTSTYLELASNGYVVVALDHPHHAFFTEDTAGQIVLADGDFLNTAMNLGSVNDPSQEYELYSQWMALRTADMNFALECIKAGAESGEIGENWFLAKGEKAAVLTALAKTDSSRIGLMGHSMGGATSVLLGREREDVGAVIDIDGTMLGEYLGVEEGKFVINDAPYSVPVLEFVNWDSFSELQEYLSAGNSYPNEELMKNAHAGFRTTVQDTKHMDYTDLPMFSPALGNLLGSGSRSTKETMTIVNSLVLSFYDCYLKGEGVFTVQEVY